jgi:tRNA(Ile)-lysidine synthase
MAAKHGARCVYLAHHADDQAETILGNLCRGTGIRGLAGMRRESQAQGGLILLRPLLHLRRAQIDAYTVEHALAFREDSSNTSLKHRRNRLRHQVLPLLKEVFNRDVSPLIARLGTQAERDDDCLRQQAIQFTAQPGILNQDMSLTTNAELRSLHPAVLSRVLAFWLSDKLQLPHIETGDIDAAMSMLRPGGPAKINLHAGKYLRRRAGVLFVE